MKDISGKITSGEPRQLSRETIMKHVPTEVVGGKSQDDLGSDESLEGTGQVLADGKMGQPTRGAATSASESPQRNMEKWALDNAPPPIKVRRDVDTSEESSPRELSPAPSSPKRMKELAGKTHIQNLPFSKVFSHDSI